MIGAASFAPLAVALLLWEAPRVDDWRRRLREVISCGAILVGLSSFQLEFDMGIPQWQALYQPVLIAAATGFGLVLARTLLGRWGALRAVLVFWVLRGALSLLVGPVLGHTTAHIPLYLGEALCVEVAFAIAAAPLARALLSGGLIATAGLATEWGWSWAWSAQPWQAGMLPHLWVASLAAVVAAMAGAVFAGAILADARGAQRALPRWTAAAAVLALLALLAVPMARDRSAATLVISTWPVGAAQTATDRNGQQATVRHVAVAVRVTPAGAADGADWFRLTAWQGGSVIDAPLRAVAPGVYGTDQRIPVGGDWKSMVFLASGRVLAAAPVAMPAEPDQQLGAIPLLPQRTAALASAQLLLMRENHGGASWVADAAYTFFALMLLLWVVALALGARRLAGHDDVTRGAPVTMPPGAKRHSVAA
jgi:hypothetical protein